MENMLRLAPCNLITNRLRPLFRQRNPTAAVCSHRENDANTRYDRTYHHGLCERVIIRLADGRLLNF